MIGLFQRPSILIAAFAILCLSFFLGEFAGEEDFKSVAVFFAICALILLLLQLGRRYWFVIIFAFTSGLPALPMGNRPVELAEVSSFICFCVFIIMIALKRKHLKLYNFSFVFVCLFVAWVAVVYSKNPIGFAFLGSSDIGIGVYLRIACGFAAFLILSCQIISENDCKWIIRVWFIAICLGTGWAIFESLFIGSSFAGVLLSSESDEYGWRQSLSAPASIGVLYLFCRYGTSKIFSISYPVLVLVTAFAFLIALLSGKRAVVASIILIPFLAGMLKNQRGLAIAYISCIVLLIGSLVVGHGNYFELPYPIQRSLANLPGHWDPAIMNMTAESTDAFREEMRDLAWDKISRNPIQGGGVGLKSTDISNITQENVVGNIAKNLALGSSWHNTWLGLWADFGIPAVILHVGIVFLLLRNAWLAYKGSERPSVSAPSSFHVLSMMLFLQSIFILLRSYTSGSSDIAYSLWWQFGLVVALANSLAYYKKNDLDLNGIPMLKNKKQASSPGDLLFERFHA